MPNYDYYCPANEKTVEVNHRMSELLKSWREVCERAEIDLGEIPPDSPVEKKISAGAFIHSPGEGGGSLPDFSGGSCCGGGCG
ncbi:MAG: zinc ribbon domain-containing protein [Gammaproteobacteria bacterium]|nr:zinc ribbon domain-containing protein [Gammaproteobacteria bacterium]